MALKATVFRATLAVSDLDRQHYATYSLSLARHPSETDERMMVRLLAFVLFASEQLAFGRGLSTEDEPDLWEKDLTGAVTCWIEVGLPDPRRLRQASGRADSVVVLAYGGRPAGIWWQTHRAELSALDKLAVIELASADTAALASLAQRSMQIEATVQDELIWLHVGETTLEIRPVWLQRAGGDQ